MTRTTPGIDPRTAESTLPDSSTAELLTVRLQLRNDLRFAQQSAAGAVFHVVEDPVHARFFRIGRAEYAFLSLCDGQRTVQDILAWLASTLEHDALTDQEAGSLCRWLVEEELATTADSRSIERLETRRAASRRARALEWINPIMLKLPLGNPTRIVEQFGPLLAWLFQPVGVVIWFFTVGPGMIVALSNTESLLQSAGQVIAGHEWVRFALVWLALKLVHELAHAAACRRFGGHVRQAGILFILGIPLPYVDVSSAWMFPSKWHRIATSFAGMYVELLIAAVAALGWSASDSPTVRQLCLVVMTTAGIATVVFNANPLMRFDGYHMLADWTEIPNLAGRAQRWLRGQCKRVFLGLRTKPDHLPGWRGILVPVYGILAAAWRILICVSLLIAAEAIFHGAGVIFAAVAIVAWYGLPTVRLVRYLVAGTSTERPNRLQCALVSSVVVGLAWTLLQVLPARETVRLPAVVEFEQPLALHATVGGFVHEILVSNGATVQPGDPLVVLQNPEVAAELTELRAEADACQLRAKRHLIADELAAWKVELKNEQSLRERIALTEQKIEDLILTAPCEGNVIAPHLQDQQGNWIRPGQFLLTIARPDQKHLLVLIPQPDIDSVRQQLDNSARFDVDGDDVEVQEAHLREILPQGLVELPNLAFAATSGGPLAVRQATEHPDKHPAPQGSGSPAMLLLEPHFQARIPLSAPLSMRYGHGQLAEVRLSLNRGPIGERMLQRFRDWLRNRRLDAQQTF